MLASRESGSGIAPVPVGSPDAKVFVAKPWQKSVHPLTAFCVEQLCNRKGIAKYLHFGDAFVTHTRNKCADAFLASSCDWMLMVDDDMIIPFGDAKWFNETTRFNSPEPFASFNAIDRLLSHKHTLVGALYAGRYPKSSLMYNEGTLGSQEAVYARSGPHDVCKPTRWVATGCMLVHRSVFEDIEKKFPRLARAGDKKGGQWFTSTEASLLARVQSIHDNLLSGPMTGEKAFKALEGLELTLAASKVENPLGSGEDVSFCLRAAAAGHIPHVDLGLVCGHIGHCVYGLRNTGLK